ncbi:MAG: tripartite tricarboxylate transporter substrate binding protein [Pigmentiphaga sp.]
MPNSVMSRRTVLRLAGAALAAALATGTISHAQPRSTPLRVILPLSPGSGVDVIFRSAQSALSNALGGQPVVVDNIPGAGGIIGTQALVRAAPDGNTIGVISNNHAVNPSLYREMPYDSLADIAPISIVGGSPFVLVTNPDKLPASNARELQTLLKARPGDYNYGSSGTGTIIHLAGAMFLDAVGGEAEHIPYKGLGPMIVDILGGQTDLGASAVAAVQGQIRSGALRAIGVMGKQRINWLPELPTFAEQGFPEIDVSGWFAVIGPKGMPQEEVERLNRAISEAFNDPGVKAGFAQRDDYLSLTTPQETGEFLAAEQARYADLVHKIGIPVN